MRLAPPDVEEAYCISCTERTPRCVVSSSRSGMFDATFLSDERQQSGQMKAVGCWFES